MEFGNFLMAMKIPHHVAIVFLFLEEKAREAILELDNNSLHADDAMKKLYEKLNTLFLENANQLAFITYKSF